MNVLHLGKFWPPYYGGIESVHWGIHAFLNHNGVSCKSIVFDNSDTEERFVLKAKYILLFGKVPISLSYLVLMWKEFKSADVIHIHFPNPIVIIFFILRWNARFAQKIVIHWHSDLVKTLILDKFYHGLISIFVFRRSSCVIVTSAVYKDSSTALRDLSLRYEVIPNFNLRSISSVRSVFELRDKSDVYLLSVGRNTEYKGFNFLIECMCLLPVNYKLTIIGKDVSLLDIPASLKSRVSLQEEVDEFELKAIYEASDIFVLGSHTRAEAFGVVLIEAMFYGLPTVSFGIPGSGVLEVVNNNVTGFLVENRNVSQMASAVRRLVSEPGLYEFMSRNSIERSLSFSKDVVCPRFLNLYIDLWKTDIRD